MRGKNSWCLVLGLILFCSFVSAIRINEIELNPIGTDSGNEWVELYSEENISLTNWSIKNNDGDSVNLTSFNESILGFLIINFSGQWLDNSNEKIILIYNNSVINETPIFADSLDSNLSWTYCDGNWLFLNSTRGFMNDCPNESIISECDWQIEILLNKYIFEKSTDVNWTVKVSKSYGEKANVTVRGYVKDLLSSWVMDYRPWTKEEITNYRNQKYTPNLWGDKFYEIAYNITELSCEDSYTANDFDTKFIIVLPKPLGTNYTNLKINELLPDPDGYDNAPMPLGEFVELYNSGSEDLELEGLGLKDNYGENIDIFISNSNTLNGTVIKANSYLTIYMNGREGFLNNNDFEKISLFIGNELIDEISYDGSNENMSWSKFDGKWIQLEPSPGSENLEEVEEEEEEEETVSLKTETTKTKSIEIKQDISESNLKDSITGNVIFEDKGLKQKRSALYFFCALLILIIVYYCYGREEIIDKSCI